MRQRHEMPYLGKSWGTISDPTLRGCPFLSATASDSLILCWLSRFAVASAERSRNASNLKTTTGLRVGAETDAESESRWNQSHLLESSKEPDQHFLRIFPRMETETP